MRTAGLVRAETAVIPKRATIGSLWMISAVPSPGYYYGAGRGDSTLRTLVVAARCWAGVNLLPKHVIAGDIGGEEGGTAQIPDTVGVYQHLWFMFKRGVASQIPDAVGVVVYGERTG